MELALDEPAAREEVWAREEAPVEAAAARCESSSGHTLGGSAAPRVPRASPAADLGADAGTDRGADPGADLAADLAAGRLTMAQYASQARTAGASAAEVTAMLKRHAAAKEPAVLLRMDLAAGRLTMAEWFSPSSQWFTPAHSGAPPPTAGRLTMAEYAQQVQQPPTPV